MQAQQNLAQESNTNSVDQTPDGAPQRPNDRVKKVVTAVNGVYWAEHFAAGRLLAYGPVLAPGAAFGLGIVAVDDEAEARQFGENDPSVLAGFNRFEIHPMHLVASRSKD